MKPLNLKPEAGRPGGVQPGDIVWLAQRRKQPDVRISTRSYDDMERATYVEFFAERVDKVGKTEDQTS